MTTSVTSTTTTASTTPTTTTATSTTAENNNNRRKLGYLIGNELIKAGNRLLLLHLCMTNAGQILGKFDKITCTFLSKAQKYFTKIKIK